MFGPPTNHAPPSAVAYGAGPAESW